MDLPLRGSCQCGAVTYEVGAEPVFTYACHCHSCQKRTGSAFSLGMVITEDSLQLRGELSAWSRVSDLGNTNTRLSCSACGNIIYGTADNTPGLAKLQPGTLEDTREVMPEVHLWTASRQPWLALPAQAPQFEGQPEAAELLQAALDYRARRGG